MRDELIPIIKIYLEEMEESSSDDQTLDILIKLSSRLSKVLDVALGEDDVAMA